MLLIALLALLTFSPGERYSFGDGRPVQVPEKAGLGGVFGTGVSKEELSKVRSHIYSGKKVAKGRHEATSYGPPWNSMQGGPITSTGLALGKNIKRYIVAADPSVNNYGRFIKVWPNPFAWRGPFLVADTGGAIKKRRLDFYDWRGRKSQYGWGRRDVTVRPWRR